MNFFLSFIWFERFLENPVLPIPGGPRTFTNLLVSNKVIASHISCCLPLKFSIGDGMLLNKGVCPYLVSFPSLKLAIGNHLCSFEFFAEDVLVLSLTNSRYFIASLSLNKYLISSFANLNASQTEYFC